MRSPASGDFRRRGWRQSLGGRRRAGRHVLAGVEELPGPQIAALIQLKGSDGPEYWLAFHNFYVITRYNKSTKYAMAVFQLSREIESHRQRTRAGEP